MNKHVNCCGHVWLAGHFEVYDCRREGTLQHEGKMYCWQHFPPDVAKKRVAKLAADKLKHGAAQQAKLIAEREKQARLGSWPEIYGALTSLVDTANHGDHLSQAIDNAETAILKYKRRLGGAA
jgi:hypothetical protein